MSYTIGPKDIKYLGINFTKTVQNLSTENDIILLGKFLKIWIVPIYAMFTDRKTQYCSLFLPS